MVSPLTPPTSAASIWTMIGEDVSAVMRNDPAARSALEVLSSYPGLHAIWAHRVAHRLWLDGNHTSARMLSHFNRFITGIEIHPGAILGRRVFIDHGMGVVIGETAIVGDGCLLYKGVVLGGTTLEQGKRHPTLGEGVVVGTNACILGNVRVGDRAKIGSGSVVVKDVPSEATAVGVPSRIVSTVELHAPLDHGALPDPITTVMRSFLDEIELLRRRVDELERRHDEGPSSLDHDREALLDEQLSAMFFEDLNEG